MFYRLMLRPLIGLFLLWGMVGLVMPARAQDPSPTPDLEIDIIRESLTETFTSDDGAFSFAYPSGWLVQERGGVVALVNDQRVITENEISSGMVGAQIFSPPTLFSLTPDPNQRPSEALNAILAAFSRGNIQPIGEAESFNINLGLALQQRFETPDGDSAVLVFSLPENAYVAMSIGTAADEMDDFLPTLIAIAQTVTFGTVAPPIVTAAPPPEDGAALALEVRHISPNFNLSLEYPQDWLLQETDSVIIINNQTEAVDTEGNYLDGTVQVIVFPLLSPQQYAPVLGLDATASSAELLEAYTATYVPNDPDETVYSEIETQPINRLPSARQIVSGPNGDVVYYVIKDADGSIFLMALGTPNGALEPYLDTAAAIAESLRRLR